jgi:PAS domain S-box-containing protein
MENKQIKILAIDDIPDNLVSIRAQLRQAFPEAIIFTALNGAKGIELATSENPDVILLDIVMPDMDGYEVCKLLKADHKRSNIPVVFVTANKSDQVSRIRALECGAEALLAKPIDPIELTAQIRAMVKIKDANIIKQNEEERLTQLVGQQIRELKENHTATLNLLEDLRNEVEIRKQSEAALLISELRFKQVSEDALEWIWEIDTEGLYTYTSPVVETLLGYKTTEIVGKKHFYDFFTPDIKDELKAAAFDAFSRKEKIRNFENPNIHIDGHIAILESNASPIIDSEGNLIGYRGVDSDITERKNSEKKIHEKDILFRKLLSNVPDLIYQFTRRPDGTYFVPVASEGIWNIFGCSPEDVMEDFAPIARVLYPEDSARIISDIEYSAQNLTQFTCEFRVQIPGKAIQWIYSKSTPELLTDGSITWYGFDMDITRRKQAEEALHHNELLQSKMLVNIGDVIVIIDKEGINRHKSSNIERWFGWKPEEVVGKSTWENVHPDDLNSAQQFVGNLMNKTDSVGTTECRYRCKDGSYKWIEISMTNLINDPDIQGILGNYHDITERKLVEQELIIAKDSAQESETRLKLATSAGHLGIWDWNVKDNVMVWDDRMFELYGIAKDTFPSNIDAWTNGLHPDDKQRAIDECYASLNNGKSFDTSFRVVHPNGKIVHVKANALVFKEPDGKPQRMIGINKDVSESVYAEEQLILAKEHAEQSDRLKSAFLANMSHEIRTPMNGILGFAELLKDSDLNSEQQQDYIRIIEKSGARMLNIINDIVDISKIESQQMKVSVSVTNVNEKIEYIHTFFKPETDKKGIELRFNNGLPEIKASILTDKEKIYAILTNLVKNAIKFCDEGVIEIGYNLVESLHATPLPNTTTSLPNPEMSLQFYVKDTGIGIPKNRQEAIFDRFVQADIADKRAFQGAGLGLSISKAYVEMLGGQIWVESEEGKGSTFYFTLPYRTELEEEPTVTNISIKEAETLIHNLKILIAEDDEVSEKLLETIVKKFSLKIFKAKTGFEAIAACHDHPDIDLVLMDIKMPGMDGYEATRQIRQFNPGVVIIAQTAYALIGDSYRAKMVGCNDYIVKPIDKIQLHNMINKHFREQVAS